MSIGEWILAVVAALGVGIGKAGLSGMGMFHVLIFAFLFRNDSSRHILLAFAVLAALRLIGG